VRVRMQGEGISYAEFSYMLLQAYDFLVLHERHGCELQIGGSDQWGNITAGIDLIRRRRGARAWGLTVPLLTTAGGQKLGKTEEGTVWLDPDRTSPYRFFQHWVRTEDADVGRFLRMLTFVDLEEIDEVLERSAAAPGQREAQRRLARELTRLVHGPEESAAAEEASLVLFGAPLEAASEAVLASLTAEVPSTRVARSRLEQGIDLVEVLLDCGLATSRGDARRAISGGGLYVNNHRQAGTRLLAGTDLLHGRYVVLRRGRADYHVLVAA
jgi:tyrosyl-tRNA synthetase